MGTPARPGEREDWFYFRTQESGAVLVTFTQRTESYKTAYVVAAIRAAKMDREIAPALRDAITERIEQSRANLILDLSQVETIATASLATLLEFKYRLAAYQRRLLLAHVQPEVIRALRVTRMENLLPCIASVEEAIRLLAE